MSFRPIRAIVRKDLLVHLTDRRAVILSFLLPAALAAFMSIAFRSSGDGPKALRVPILVSDEDQSEGSRRLVAALQADPALTATPMGRAEAEEAVRGGHNVLALVLPKRFAETTIAALAEKMRRSDTGAAAAAPTDLATVVFITDPTSPAGAGIAASLIRSRIVDALADPAVKARLAACGDLNMAYRVDTLSAATERYSGAGHAVAGMAVQFILMAAIESAVILITERQRGLWRRIRTAPISRARVLTARIISSAIIALMTLAFLVLFGRFVLGVELNGSLLGLGLVSLTFALMASSVGVFVSTLGKTPQATRGAGLFVILVMVMLGGAWVPTFILPDWLQTVTQFIPTRWAVDGLDAVMWRGQGIEAVLAPSALMLGVAAVLAMLAAWRFRWEE